MAINLIKINEFPESVDTKNWMVVGDANGISYKISIDNVKAELGIGALMQYRGSVVPTSPVQPAGDFFVTATQAGTYTNYGGVVVPANSFSVISRVGGAYTSSITGLDTNSVQKTDIIDDLTTGGSTKVLSAEQGLVLGADVVNLKTIDRRLDTNEFAAKNTNISTNYKIGAVIAFGNVGYVDDGSALYLNIIQGKRPLLQIVNESDTVIAQYFDNRVDFIETGIKEVDIFKQSTSIVYFKCLINWDIVNGGSWDLGKTLQINPKVNYKNDFKDYTNSQIASNNIQIDQKIAVNTSLIDVKLDKTAILSQTVNLFNPNDPGIVLGKWIPPSSSTGALENFSAGPFVTGFLGPFETDDVIRGAVIGKSFLGYVAVFDTDKNQIPKSDVKITSYKMLEGEKYLRIAFQSNDVASLAYAANNLMLSRNDTSIYTGYVPYGFLNEISAKKIKMPNTRYGKTIVCCGDSLTQFGNYPATLGDITGATAYNIGVGGTRLAKHNNVDYDKFSMYRLADAIVSGDWSLQIAAAANLGGVYPAIVARMQLIDFATVDIITIFFGTNDLTGNNPIGTNSDTTGLTIKGAMNYVINTILTAYPSKQLIFITPIYRNVSGVSSDTFTNTNGDKLIDIVHAEEEICELQHIEYLSMYNTAGINSKTITTYLTDGTHPTQFGYDMLGRRIAGYINIH